MQRVLKGKPPRLDLFFQRLNAPVYFVTFNTHARVNLLAIPEVHEVFVVYCRRAAGFRIGVGRYVLMRPHPLVRLLRSWMRDDLEHMDQGIEA